MDSEGTIYVVMGSTGEYSDRTEWPVCAYSDKSEAQTHCQLATAYVNEHNHGDWRYDNPASPYDPNLRIYGYDIGYYVMDVPVRVAAPKDGAEQ